VNKNIPPVGFSQEFVLARGLRQIDDLWALVGDDGSLRVFAEVTADPDRPDVRPHEAYQVLLSSMQPGWTVRVLQIFWPDPSPRQAFQEQAKTWNVDGEGLCLLHQSLLLYTQESPLPFNRRTILEYVLPPGEEGLSWWQGIEGWWYTFGLRVVPLGGNEIQQLAHWIFNPTLE
jgi:hypothetical protein